MRTLNIIQNTALGIIAGTLATLPAMAATISGQLTADNYFEVYYGTPNSGYVSGGSDNDGTQWNTMRGVKFEIPDDMLADCDCRIAVAVWGDGRVAEGLYGFLEWNGNRVHTGNPEYRVATAGPSNTINGGTIGAYVNPNGPQAQPNPFNWGIPSGGGQSQWIWSGGTGGTDNNVRVFSLNCSDVVRRRGDRPVPKFGTVQPAFNTIQPLQRAPTRTMPMIQLQTQ